MLESTPHLRYRTVNGSCAKKKGNSRERGNGEGSNVRGGSDKREV
jgi:hypothetical protein